MDVGHGWRRLADNDMLCSHLPRCTMLHFCAFFLVGMVCFAAQLHENMSMLHDSMIMLHDNLSTLHENVSMLHDNVAEIRENIKVVQKNITDIAEQISAVSNGIDGSGSLLTSLIQVHAHATCTALGPGSWVFAVQRDCSNEAPSCADICSFLIDDQAGHLTCFNSLHVYEARTPFNRSYTLGLKTYKYNGCGGSFCGPNYCCCTKR